MIGITVLFNDNHYKIVSGIELDQLLTTDKVKAFRRSTGWVIIGKDPLRGQGGNFAGRERRKQTGRRCGNGSRFESQQAKVQKGRLCLTCENLVEGKCISMALTGTLNE
jgi:hypothetical protein